MTSGRIDAVGLAEQIRRGERAARDVVEAAIHRIDARNPTLNAVVRTRLDEARAEVEKGLPDGPLRGVPILVKDLGVRVAGLAVTNGSRLFLDAVASQDSELVKRYRRAGAVVLGITNTPEFGMSATTEPLQYGPTRNPWRLTHSTGGSSGGSAAAVAAGIVPVAHGNDGGGSIRQPASMCGLVGLKPSRGRVPNYPHAGGLGRPFTTNHVLTTTVRDSAAFLDVAAGNVPGDLVTEPARKGTFEAAVDRQLARLRIAVTLATKDHLEPDETHRAAVRRAADRCSSLGHEVVEVPGVYEAAAADRNHTAVMLANLQVTVEARLAELGRKLGEDDVEPTTMTMLEDARSLSAADVVRALNSGQEMAWEIARELDGFDLLLMPVLPKSVPPLGEMDTTMYHAYTAVWNMTGQPAISVPFGVDDSGLPVGVQFVAGLGREHLLLGLAGQLEKAAPWPTSPDPASGPAEADSPECRGAKASPQD